MKNFSFFGFIFACGALLLCQHSFCFARQPEQRMTCRNWAGVGGLVPVANVPAAEARKQNPGLNKITAHGPLPTVHSSWGWDRAWRSLESIFGNQKRMFQLALIGMCIALYIMFRSRS